jgi:hypothetical protein
MMPESHGELASGVSSERYDKLRELADRELDQPVWGLMLYGSHARGDSSESSDIDLLQVSDRPRHYERGSVSVSVYTPTQLLTMSRAGSLFAMHLKLEGKIVSDDHGYLADALSHFRRRRSYRPILRAIMLHARLLDADEALLESNAEGLARLSLYLVRTAAAAKHIVDTGRPVFGVPELSANLHIAALVDLFADRHIPERLNIAKVLAARRVLEELLTFRIRNPYGSLAALAVNMEPRHPLIARMALRLMAGQRTVGYGDVLLDPTVAAYD